MNNSFWFVAYCNFFFSTLLSRFFIIVNQHVCEQLSSLNVSLLGVATIDSKNSSFLYFKQTQKKIPLKATSQWIRHAAMTGGWPRGCLLKKFHNKRANQHLTFDTHQRYSVHIMKHPSLCTVLIPSRRVCRAPPPPLNGNLTSRN